MRRRRSYLPLPQIEEREDKHPDEIDEMPVKPGDFHGRVAALAIIKSGPDSAGNDAQIDHAGRHVQAVKARDHEKRRTELRSAHGIAPRAHAFMNDELG